MKKWLTLLLCLCLLFPAALAEEVIPLQHVEVDGLIGLAVPEEWEAANLSDEDMENGLLVVGRGQDVNLEFSIQYQIMDPSLTAEDYLKLFQEDEFYSQVELVENQHGTKIIRYSFADQTMTGFYVPAPYGIIYIFSYFHADRTLIQPDDTLLFQLVDDSLQAVHLPAGEVAE